MRKSESRAPTVVITGASAGIGRATAKKFAAGGYDVGLIARGRDGLEAAAEEVRGCGQRALVQRRRIHQAGSRADGRHEPLQRLSLLPDYLAVRQRLTDTGATLGLSAKF